MEQEKHTTLDDCHVYKEVRRKYSAQWKEGLISFDQISVLAWAEFQATNPDEWKRLDAIVQRVRQKRKQL